MNDKKIVIEIEVDMPSDFDASASDSEIFELRQDIKSRFEGVTGYSIQNIYIQIEDK